MYAPVRKVREPGRWNWALGAAACFAAGCGSSDDLRRPSSPAATLSAGPGNVLALTERLVVLADTQFQFLHGAGIDMRTAWADLAAATAIRPPQLDMYADALLEEACARTSGPLVHVGDAGNGSCVGELDTLFAVLARCREPHQWAFAPGNHDGFFLGTSDRVCEDGIWARHCGGEARKLTKPRLVEEYLARHLRPAWGLVDDPTTVPTEPDISCGRATTAGLGEAACWRAREDDRWRSFVVQRVDLSSGSGPRVHGVLLDTSQFEEYPKPLPRSRDAGSTGSVLADQLDVAEQWATATPGDLFVFFGHHPLDELGDDSWLRLTSLVSRRPNVVLYVSAHTHRGWVRNHAIDAGPFVELNLASITDPPNEYRDLQLFAHDGTVYFESTANPGLTDPACRPEWSVPAREYVAYREPRGLDPVATQTKILELQAAAWVRFLRHVGLLDPDAGQRLGRELRAALEARTEHALRAAVIEATRLELAERERPPTTPEHAEALELRHRYRRCVALEAARGEKQPARRGLARAGCPRPAKARGKRACTDHEIVPLPARGAT